MSDSQQTDAAAGSRQNWDAPLDTPEHRKAAFNAAFDYRGDVTLQTTDGRIIEGYVYNHKGDVAAGDAALCIMPKDGGRLDVPCDEITSLVFSGRDTAAGTSWETWVKKYVAKKMEERV